MYAKVKTYKPFWDLGGSFFKIKPSNQVQGFFFPLGKNRIAARILPCNITRNVILWAAWTSYYSYNFKTPPKVILKLGHGGKKGKLVLDSTSLVLNLELMANRASWAGLSRKASDCGASQTLLVGWMAPPEQAYHLQRPMFLRAPQNNPFQESLRSPTVCLFLSCSHSFDCPTF